jgi:hypothetical protein
MSWQNFDLYVLDVEESSNQVKFKIYAKSSSLVGETKDPATSILDKANAADGLNLYKALFPGDVGALFLRCREKVPPIDSLRIRLHLPPALQVYPWETMACNIAGGEPMPSDIMSLNPKYSIVRYIDMKEAVAPTVLKRPARVLFAAASPDTTDLWPLQINQAKSQLLSSCGSNKLLELVPIVPASRDLLFDDLKRNKSPIFVFFGHGNFPLIPDATNNGVIYLQAQADDAKEEVSAVDLCEWLRHAETRVALFYSCSTAKRDAQHHWYGIAPALVKSGVAAIIAMQAPISEASGLVMAANLLASLTAGVTIDEALYLLRLELRAKRSDDWAKPVLYMRDETGIIFPEYADDPKLEKKRKELRKRIRINAKQIIGTAEGNVINADIKASSKNSSDTTVNVEQKVKRARKGSTVTNVKYKF